MISSGLTSVRNYNEVWRAASFKRKIDLILPALIKLKKHACKLKCDHEDMVRDLSSLDEQLKAADFSNPKVLTEIIFLLTSIINNNAHYGRLLNKIYVYPDNFLSNITCYDNVPIFAALDDLKNICVNKKAALLNEPLPLPRRNVAQRPLI